MTISISGMDKLINKLNKLSNIEAKKIIKDVAIDVEKAIYNGCPEDTEKSKESIGQCEERYYGNSFYLDIGLANDNAPFDDWKGAWFNNWGFDNHGKMVTKHVMWFNDAISSVEKQSLDKIKKKVKEEVKSINNM